MLWSWLACAPSTAEVPQAQLATNAPAGDDVVSAPAELRGVWVTRFSYASPEDVRTAIAEVAEAGFNTVFFQVRGTFDAFYASPTEPWAARLSGTLGRDPGWDPLGLAVSEGHQRGLAVHAYLNVFPLWSGTAPPTDPGHAWLAHPEWRLATPAGRAMELNEHYVFADPANPEVRRRVAQVASEIERAYDVDGIHLDYVRYPGPDFLPDADLGRSFVSATVRGVSEAVDVPVTAAVWGVYENRWQWSGVSQGNIDYYQDSRAMLDEGLLDATLPMIYWPVTEPAGERLDFATLAADHLAHAGGRHVYPGVDASLGPDRVVACIRAARSAGAPGFVLFDWSQARTWLARLREELLAEPAVVPAMPWRGGRSP